MLTVLEVSDPARPSEGWPGPAAEPGSKPLRRVIVQADRATWTEARGRELIIEHLEAPLWPGSTRARALVRARGLRELVQLHRPAVIVCASPALLPVLVRLASFRLEPRPALVGWSDGDVSDTDSYVRRELARVDPRLAEPGGRALAWWTRQGLASFDAVFVGSRDAGRRLWARGLCRLYYVPRGVDLDRFTPAPREPSGRRPRIWIEAPSDDPEPLRRLHAALCRRLPVDPQLVIRAPLGPALERFAAAHAEVEVGSFDDASERAGQLAACDLALLSSDPERRRSACAEAMACGLPLVGAGGGVGDRIRDAGCGRALDEAGPEALAEAVAELIRDGQLAELGRRARRFIEGFDLDACDARELLCLREVVDCVRSGRGVPTGIHERTPAGYGPPAALAPADEASVEK